MTGEDFEEVPDEAVVEEELGGVDLDGPSF